MMNSDYISGAHHLFMDRNIVLAISHFTKAANEIEEHLIARACGDDGDGDDGDDEFKYSLVCNALGACHLMRAADADNAAVCYELAREQFKLAMIASPSAPAAYANMACVDAVQHDGVKVADFNFETGLIRLTDI